MPTDLVIHGHFYQPPRENPWTGIVERDPALSPYHDWNDRIHDECYGANAYARVFDAAMRIERIANNYEGISFNFGPTLLSWIEKNYPETHARIVDADVQSRAARGGHGNAIAQGYNHAILPLCSERDRLTQIRWGLADFRHRFGREPEALWLPETACNDDTLGALIDAGMKYAVLSPHQAERVRVPGACEWMDVSDGRIDPGTAYRYHHRDGSGRSLALFFYDGPAARAIAFENVLVSSQTFVGRLHLGKGRGRLVHVATDGESYGHHFRHGERTLAHALLFEAATCDLHLTNYGEFLERTPPELEVEIKTGDGGDGTAWSCSHGLGRWRRDCGCSTGAREGWNQAWRGPLRDALDLLRDEAAARFAATEGELFDEPWATRDAYIDLLLDPGRPRADWLRARATRRILGDREMVRALKYLEMQRNEQLMYTSCGWFFADISGIESVQVLKYAGRVLDLLDDLGLEAPRERFLGALSEAKSNLAGIGNGADVFRKLVDPARVSPKRIAAHLAISSLVSEGDESDEVAGFEFSRTGFHKQRHGRVTLATSRLELVETTTTQRHEFAFASLYLGGVDFHCVLADFADSDRFRAANERLWTSFRTASLPTLLRIMQDEFGPDEYGLESLLPDGREQISELVLGNVVHAFTEQYIHLYESNQRTLEMLQEAGFDLPRELRVAAEFALSSRFMWEITSAHRSPDPEAYRTAFEIADEARRRGLSIDRTAASRLLGDMIADLVVDATQEGAPLDLAVSAASLVELARRVGADRELVRGQNYFFPLLERGVELGPELAELRAALGFATR